MNYLKQFKIPFKGLSLGSHSFEWQIDKAFFEALENEDILNCDLKIELELERKERMFILDFYISGKLKVICDRCSENFDLPVNISEKYYIKLGEEFKEESEDVLVIPETEYQLDISALIFDYISLALPIKKVHAENEEGQSGCNPEILSKMNELNLENKIDPRWEALKNLNIDNNN